MAAGASALLLAGAIIGVVILLSGVVSIEATKQHFRITHRVLDMGLRFSVRTRAVGIEAPPLDDPAMIARGFACYRMHCAQCHGSPTAAPEAHALGLLPAASNLAQSGREWPPERLYYVAKKGVRMTGMPAWEYRISDAGLWATTAFLLQLPSLDRARYAALESSAQEVACPRSVELPRSREPGKTVLLQYSCHSCHRIEGVVGPEAHVGPPLIDWPKRKYIAGVLPNTPENLVRWIREPHAISPATLMPDLHVAEAHAREMAQYLFSLD